MLTSAVIDGRQVKYSLLCVAGRPQHSTPQIISPHKRSATVGEYRAQADIYIGLGTYRAETGAIRFIRHCFMRAVPKRRVLWPACCVLAFSCSAGTSSSRDTLAITEIKFKK